MSSDDSMTNLAEAADQQSSPDQISVLKQELFSSLKDELLNDFKTDLLSEVKQLLTDTLATQQDISRKPADDCISLSAPSINLSYDEQSSEKQSTSNSLERILAQDMKSFVTAT